MTIKKNNEDDDIDIQFLGEVLHTRGFKSWFLFFFKQVEGQKFIVEPIHHDLFKCFQDIYDLKTTRQVINIPPRSSKTSMAIYFIAYALAKDLKCNFIYTSFSQELLASNSKRLATILNDKLYQEMYLDNNISEEQIDDSVIDDFWKNYYKLNYNNVFKFTSKQITTREGGVVLFNSIGSSITGFGAGRRNQENFSGMLILDDPNKPIEVHSERIRNKVKTYFEETLLSRLNNSMVPILNIQQRLHLEDLSGFLIKEYGFDVLKRPLVDEKGVCQLPQQYTEKRIEELKKNNYLFTSQYQQEPIRLGGTLIKTEWFKIYNESLERYKQIYIVCDTAFSTKTSADNSAFMLVGITFENNLHILDMYVNKMDFVELKRNLINFYDKAQTKYSSFNIISAIYIENKASGQSIIQELRQARLPVKELYPTYWNAELKREEVKDKYTRFLEISTDIENGYVYIPEHADWVLEFLAECESFDGLGTYKDDRIDCLIYALKVRRQRQDIDWDKSLDEFNYY